jgi:hypothetical protein
MLDLVLTIDIVLNRLINGTYYLPCFALLVMVVASTKILFKKQALAAGTKQSRQADKSVRLKRQSGLPALFCAIYYRLLFQMDIVLTNTP